MSGPASRAVQGTASWDQAVLESLAAVPGAACTPHHPPKPLLAPSLTGLAAQGTCHGHPNWPAAFLQQGKGGGESEPTARLPEGKHKRSLADMPCHASIMHVAAGLAGELSRQAAGGPRRPPLQLLMFRFLHQEVGAGWLAESTKQC